MLKIIRLAAALPLAAVFLLSACGGGSSTNLGSSNPTNNGSTSPGGIFYGTLKNSANGGSSTNNFLECLISESGEAKCAASSTSGNSSIQVLALSTIAPNAQKTISGSFAGYALNGSTFADGNPTETGTFSGTLQSRLDINATYSGTGGDSGSASVDYLGYLYENASSLSEIAGNYTFTYSDSAGTETATVAVDASGNVSGSDTAKCQYSGQLQDPDTNYNLYTGSLTQTCNMVAETFDTLATFAPSYQGSVAKLTLIGTSNAAMTGFDIIASATP